MPGDFVPWIFLYKMCIRYSTKIFVSLSFILDKAVPYYCWGWSWSRISGNHHVDDSYKPGALLLSLSARLFPNCRILLIVGHYQIILLCKRGTYVCVDLAWVFTGQKLNHNLDYWVLFSPTLDNTRVMMTVWRLRGNIIRNAVLDFETQCSQSAAHLYEQFLQVKQIGFVTHWDRYAVRRGSCLELLL